MQRLQRIDALGAKKESQNEQNPNQQSIKVLISPPNNKQTQTVTP